MEAVICYIFTIKNKIQVSDAQAVNQPPPATTQPPSGVENGMAVAVLLGGVGFGGCMFVFNYFLETPPNSKMKII